MTRRVLTSDWFWVVIILAAGAALLWLIPGDGCPDGRYYEDALNRCVTK